MEKNESITQVLENLVGKTVYKTKTSIVWSLLLVAAGITFFIIYTFVKWEISDVLPHFLFAMGSVFIIVGLSMFFFRKEHYFSTENNQKLTRKEFYFQQTDRDKLVKFIETGRLEEIKDLNTSVSDGLKMTIMSTKDGQLCLSQVILYVGTEYVNLTSVKKHSLDEARWLNTLNMAK